MFHIVVKLSVTFCLYFQFDDGEVRFDGKLTAKDIEAFVVANKLPLVIEFNQEVSINDIYQVFFNKFSIAE